MSHPHNVRRKLLLRSVDLALGLETFKKKKKKKKMKAKAKDSDFKKERKKKLYP